MLFNLESRNLKSNWKQNSALVYAQKQLENWLKCSLSAPFKALWEADMIFVLPYSRAEFFLILSKLSNMETQTSVCLTC